MKKTINIPKTFIGFLSASVFFWLLINLSKEYKTEVEFDIEYTKLPQQKILLKTPLKKLKIILKSTGYQLFSTSLSNKPIQLNLQKATHKKRNNYFFLSKDIIPNIQNQLKKEIEIIEIIQDTIPLKIGSLASKKIPLKANIDINFQLGYDLYEDIYTTPDSVLISGDKTEVSKTTFLILEKKQLNDVSKNTNIKAKILIPEKSTLKVSHKNAITHIKVDKFTEGEIEVPITLKNAPKGASIFPKTVKITYKVGLQNFNKITTDTFIIVCDFNDLKNSDAIFLIPKIIKSSDLISLVRTTPNKIDYLIYE